jgi:hypothetical protein
MAILLEDTLLVLFDAVLGGEEGVDEALEDVVVDHSMGVLPDEIFSLNGGYLQRLNVGVVLEERGDERGSTSTSTFK